MIEKPVVKWFIRIWCVIMAVGIMATAVSAALVVGMDSMVYSCSGEDACIIQLDFENRRVRYLKYTSVYDNRWMEGEMTDFMAWRLKFSAAFANAPLWLENYTNGSEEQADAWSMDMRFGNRVKTCRGAGEYPIRWKMIIRKIMNIAEIFPEMPEEYRTLPENAGAAYI